MNKSQAVEQIKQLFHSEFNRERYTYFLRNLLNNFEERDSHYSGNTVPDAYRQHINQYWRIGKYTDPDKVEMDLYVVEVKSLSKLDRARTALRNFAVRTMHAFGDKDHALIAFYAKEDSGADWRFSYVRIEHRARLDEKRGKVKTKKEPTPAKRYSFLVGKHENSHTAQAQLVDLLAMDYDNPKVEEIEKAFSIEKITKEFFEQYKDLFIRLSDVLTGQPFFRQEQDSEKRKQKIAKFAKKLLGQIVFLYFLQKKGWLGVADGEKWGKGERRFLKKLFLDAEQDGQNYYLEKLQFLFYEALACDRKGEPDPDYYQRFECKIPFLNGGLFEPDSEYDWREDKIEIPNSIFFNNQKNKAGDKGTGILNVFDRYNFTIKEDEPLEKEVAVDPEMLGKVFENMLEITERKSKGAFYTPREIVHYMCQESLIHYLNGEVGEETATAISKTDIDTLVRKGIFAIENDQRILAKGKETDAYSFELPESIRNNAQLIDTKLADIKICDPAIGSGAFPVGMLHEIVHARQALLHHLPESNRLRPYDLKKHTIGHSIYGVDIDSSAIDIARLRLWLSLVVDEDDYTSIDALPNLDYKIMQGNSLIEEYEGIKLFDEEFIREEDGFLEREKAVLKQKQAMVESKCISAWRSGNKKLEAEYKAQAMEIAQALKKIERQEIKQVQEKNAGTVGLFDLVSEARKKAGHLESLHQRFFNVSSPKEKRDLRDRITKIEWELIEATLLEQNKTKAIAKLAEYRNAGEKPWFLWKLNFSEVFKQKGGFDIVIGNPPYIREKGNANYFDPVNRSELGQKYHQGKMDYWYYFLHVACDISNLNGSVGFITSRYWLNSTGASKLIARIRKELKFYKVVDIGKLKVFDNVVGHHIISLFSKCQSVENFEIKRVNDSIEDILENQETANQKIITQKNEEIYSKNQIILYSKAIRYENTVCLGTVYETSIGIQESPDRLTKKMVAQSNRKDVFPGKGVFVLSSQEVSEMDLSDEEKHCLKPYIDPSDVEKYSIKYRNNFIIYSDLGLREKIDKNKYPNIKHHLDSFAEFITSSNKPYGLHRPRSEHYFNSPKIIFKIMFKEPGFSLDEKGVYYLGFSFISVIQKEEIYSLRFLLALLNSTFAYHWFLINGKQRGAGFDIGATKLREFPVPVMGTNDVVEIIVGYLLTSDVEQNRLCHSYFEQLIDGLVYELYFPETIQTAGKEILPHLRDLKPLTDDMTEEEKLAVIQQEFERLSDPNHPVCNHLETLDSVEEVRIIREALKRK